jgi:hypothetical protein
MRQFFVACLGVIETFERERKFMEYDRVKNEHNARNLKNFVQSKQKQATEGESGGSRFTD